VAPTLATMSVSTPASGAETSTETLSVSSSTNVSSFLTASPAFFSHLATVASVTLSPSVGTTMSVISSSQRFLEKRLQFLQMLRHQACRGGRRRRPAGVARALGADAHRLQRHFQPRIDEEPAAHVLGFFLTPNQFSVRETLQLGNHRLHRPRIELLE